ncbi:MAG: CapA family protein [Haloarculaceae archaeon]
MVELGLTGDVMLGRLVDERQHEPRRDPESVWGDRLDRLRSLDGLVVNLECALSTRGEKWTRTDRPFHFRADPGWAVPALERGGVDAAALANNHLLDFGEPALLDTVAHLDDAGIAHAGAGETLDAAREPAVASVGGLDVAVVAATDNTPEYAAGEDSPGVVHLPLDPEDGESREAMTGMVAAAESRDPDLVVASLHWGPNMVTEPGDPHRAFGRWLAERVDLVHGHSAHVPQGVEVHDGTPVLYDAGDFVDDYRVDPELRNDLSFLFVADVDRSGVRQLRLEPVVIRDCAVFAAGSPAAGWVRDAMRERSREFGTDFERDGEALVLDVS